MRLISIICFLSLTSNLVGNFVWTYLEQKESINLSSEEDDTDTKKNNSKRAVNLLEEELHLAENTSLNHDPFDINQLENSAFSIVTDKPNGSEEIPLENPPEMLNEHS